MPELFNTKNMPENAKSNEVNYVEDESCPFCGSPELTLYPESATWKCEECNICWGALLKKGYFVISRYNENENQVKSEEKL